MNVVLLGPPGAGKGTQATKISQTFDLEHISTGDLFRREISNQSTLGTKAKSFMDRGELVPDEITVAMIRSEIAELSKGFLLDGFPRNVEQAKALSHMLRDEQIDIDYVVSLEVDQQHIIDRMMARGRSDDTPETIRTRLEVFSQQTAPVIEYYDQQLAVHHIDGNRSIDEVFASIQGVLTREGQV
ncbi:MAG: adenylate kinase [Bdellovibrionota bacterium]